MLALRTQTAATLLHMFGMNLLPSAAERLKARNGNGWIIELSKASSENASSSVLQWWPWDVITVMWNRLTSCEKWETLHRSYVPALFLLPWGLHVCTPPTHTHTHFSFKPASVLCVSGKVGWWHLCYFAKSYYPLPLWNNKLSCCPGNWDNIFFLSGRRKHILYSYGYVPDVVHPYQTARPGYGTVFQCDNGPLYNKTLASLLCFQERRWCLMNAQSSIKLQTKLR